MQTFIMWRVAILRAGCMILLLVAFSHIGALPHIQSPDSEIIKKRKTGDLKLKIDKLQRQLSEAKDELKKLQWNAETIPNLNPPRMIILNINDAIAIVNRGSHDGIHLSDTPVVLRKTNAGYVIVGYLDIVRIYDKDMETESIDFIPSGIHPEDEVYIINRDNSPYSLTSALLWFDRKINPNRKNSINKTSNQFKPGSDNISIVFIISMAAMVTSALCSLPRGNSLWAEKIGIYLDNVLAN